MVKQEPPRLPPCPGPPGTPWEPLGPGQLDGLSYGDVVTSVWQNMDASNLGDAII